MLTAAEKASQRIGFLQLHRRLLDFQVQRQRVLKEKHLKLTLLRDEQSFDAMHFFHPQLLPERIRAVYALMTNEYNGTHTLQLRLQHWEARE